MKKVIGLLILILVLVAVSGCTQQTKTAPVTTTVETTVPTTEATTVATAVPTTEIPVATTAVVVTNDTTVANVTAPADTTVAPTSTAAVTVSMTPSTKVTLVHIANNTFTPSVLMVLPGTGITWVNDDKSVHSVKMIGDHAGMFNSGDIVSGAKWGFSFSQDEGTYQYTDGYNTNVTGTIIVKNGDIVYGGPTLVTTTAAATNSS